MPNDLSKRAEGGSVRTFLAVNLPDEERRKLAQVVESFSPQAAVLKWSSPQLLHITLRFLGSIPLARLDAVKAAARQSAAQVDAFSLRLAGLSAFPNERAPRVIWVGLDHDSEYRSLEQLFHLLDDALVTEGFEREERSFSPHITLARTRDTITAGQRRAIGEIVGKVQREAWVQGRFEVRSLDVMRSDLARTGPVYCRLAPFPLGVENDPAQRKMDRSATPGGA